MISIDESTTVQPISVVTLPGDLAKSYLERTVTTQLG